MSFINRFRMQGNTFTNENRSQRNTHHSNEPRGAAMRGEIHRSFGRDISNQVLNQKITTSKYGGIPKEKTYSKSFLTQGQTSHRTGSVRPAQKAQGLGKAEDLSKFYKKAGEEQINGLNYIDRANFKDKLEEAEYAEGIFSYLKSIENKHTPNPSGMSSIQPDLTEKMRTILLDWLVEVHLKFKLLPETLYLTVNIIDRFLGKEKVTRGKLQLLGVAALMIASKYEEIYAPEVKDFIYITDKAYQKHEILKMENKILSLLKFEVCVPSSYRFLQRYGKLLTGGEEDVSFFLAQFLMEAAMIAGSNFLRYSPSMLAAGSLYAAQKCLSRSGWNDLIGKEGKFVEGEVKECAKYLSGVGQGQGKSTLNALRKKFSQIKFKEVARIKIPPDILDN